MKNLLFIPCYNDNENCEKIINEIHKLSNINFDILIINDGSKNEIKLKSKFLKIILINLQNNFGIGHCMKMAIKFAIKNNYNNFCRIDSDGEHDPSYIQKILLGLNKKDFIICERKISDKQNFFKTFAKKLLNITINNIFNLKFSDYNCGMMGLNLNSMKALSNTNLINYPEPQIIIELCGRKLDYNKITINQRKRNYGASSMNLFRGLDFVLITFFFILNYIMNKKKND